MKNNFIALFVLVIVHIIYDWTIPFIPDNVKPLFYSLWNISTYGYIAYRLVSDSINTPIEFNRKILSTLSVFFIYRSILNTTALIRSLRFDEEAYNAYKDITSNYTGDVLIWSIIAVFLIKITIQCRKRKTT